MRGENETGGGASAETLYDALMIRGRLFLLAFQWSAIRAGPIQTGAHTHTTQQDT